MNRHRLLLIIVLIYAAGFRLVTLDRPFEADAEGSSSLYGVLARNYLRFDWSETRGMPVLSVGHRLDAPIVFYPDHPPLVPLLIVPFYASFGVGEWQARLPFAIITLATIYALYRLVTGAAGTRAGLIAAAVFAATPMTLYFGGFPDVVGMPLILSVLFSVARYLRFHRDPGMPTLVPFVAAFAVAGVCDWPAYIIVPVFLAHFIATRPRRQWAWIAAFSFAACVLFAAVYVYIALATGSPWDWMAPLFIRRSAVVGDTGFTLTEWLGAVFHLNRTFHTLPLLITATVSLALFGGRMRHSQPGMTLVRILVAWGVLHVLIGSKAVFDHGWWWLPVTPGLVIATALLIESILDWAEKRGFAKAASNLCGLSLVLFASWSAYTTFRLLYPLHRTGKPSPMELGRAIQAAAPSPTDVALVISDEDSDAQLWFYGDRPLRTNVWSIADFERRLEDGIVDLAYDFDVQPWKAAATGFVLPTAWDNGAGVLRTYLRQRYPAATLPPDLAQKFEVFDLRHPLATTR